MPTKEVISDEITSLHWLGTSYIYATIKFEEIKISMN